MSTRSTGVESPHPKTVVCLGASFDPPHFGHAAMAVLATRAVERATGHPPEVWLLPSLARWDKTPIAPWPLRFSWCEALARGLQNQGVVAVASRAEVDVSPNFQGTVKFLRALKVRHPGVRFVFLCGEDALRSLDTWRDPEEGVPNGLALLEESDVYVVPRAGAKEPRPAWFSHPRVTLLPELRTLDDAFQKEQGLEGSLAPLASTGVRAAYAAGRAPKGYVYAALQDDIEHKARAGLYGSEWRAPRGPR